MLDHRLKKRRPPEAQQPTVIDLRVHDDLASLRYRLDQVDDGRVALRLPWDLRFLSRELDFDLLRREAQRRGLEVAVVSEDPERRQLASGSGVPAFPSVEAAAEKARWNGQVENALEPPPTYWWEQEPDLRREDGTVPEWLGWVSTGVRFLSFLIAIVVLAGAAYAIIPSADVRVVPAGQLVTVDVAIAVDPELESPVYGLEDADAMIPSRRVGLEVEGRAEVATSETAEVASGRATGEVLFTSRLPQDYLVPSGTVVRTSSTSYPIRFQTTADVVVPADGQATAPIEALDERTGNVGAYQINRVEGVAGSAVRVINPAPTTGAEAKEVPVVVQEDYDRVREQLTQELLDQAYGELHGLLEPDEFLPYPSLRVESVPKKAYSQFIGEEAETVELNMRLLVSGQAVSADQARVIAKSVLLDRMPAGNRLVDSRFDVGEITDQEGPGWFTFHVVGKGYAAAGISEQHVISVVRGKRVPEARDALLRYLPLGRPPRLETWPAWPDWLRMLDRVPVVPLRIEVDVTPELPESWETARGPLAPPAG